MSAAAVKTFKRGGTHPPEKKEMSSALAIVDAPLPDGVIVPLSQHVGAPCTPLVKKGDKVGKGQRIGEPGGFISAPIHAPISGTVASVEDIFLGTKVQAVIIDGDGGDEWADGCNVRTGGGEVTPEWIRSRVLDAGIVGLGGAAFPAHVKLSPPADKPIDCVVINGAECEPYLTADHRMMVEHPDEIVRGMEYIMKAVGAGRAEIGIEANKPDAIEAMRRAAARLSQVGVHALAVKYPQGAEKQVIAAILGRKVPAGGLPMDIGVVCSNVGTAYAIWEAIEWNRPLIRRVVTVAGEGVMRPANFMVRIGTPVQSLLAITGVDPRANRLILGGPMMGLAQYSSQVVTTKGTSGVLLLMENPIEGYRNCIRCGACLVGCPMGLNPSILSILGESKKWESARDAYNLLDCYECGVCSYVCPSKRPIVHLVKLSKSMLKKKP